MNAPQLTTRMLSELAFHEAVVLEAYLDGAGIWTWGIGVTAASGHDPLFYKDAPATLTHCFEVFANLVRTRYLPPVLKVFDGYALSEAQCAAALSFQYNTGALASAHWVRCVKAGDTRAARSAMMDWVKPALLRPRRERECRLFFDGYWSGDGTVQMLGVTKPDYTPVPFSPEKRVPILAYA